MMMINYKTHNCCDVEHKIVVEKISTKRMREREKMSKINNEISSNNHNLHKQQTNKT